MSLYGMMRTGVSGMQGQSNRLGTVADNIANAGTTGYKKSSTEFSTLVIQSGVGSYASGGVITNVKSSVAQQGVLTATTSPYDMAIYGDGFFLVQDASGQPFLTRAGSFVPDDQGRLQNAAGYYLMGYNFANGDPTPVANGFAGLEPVTIREQAMTATPSTFGRFPANLPRDADAVPAANLPSTNAPGATYTNKSSLITYDALGGEVLIDIYFTKTADNEWEMTVYNQADGATGTGFPYASPPLATETFSFDPTSGQLATASATSIDVPIPEGATLTIDMSALSQLSTGFVRGDVEVNGSGASAVTDVTISADGTVMAQYENGTMKALYRVPLATVSNPNGLLAKSGNVYTPGADSGDVSIGFAEQGGLGAIRSGALEASNVDVGEELTAMIESQRSYTANSKVFQTGSELMDILVNLKR